MSSASAASRIGLRVRWIPLSQAVMILIAGCRRLEGCGDHVRPLPCMQGDQADEQQVERRPRRGVPVVVQHAGLTASTRCVASRPQPSA